MDDTLSIWEEKGCGVHVMRKAHPEVVLGVEGTKALDCIDVPVMFFDPYGTTVEWANSAFVGVYDDDPEFRDWLVACRSAVDVTEDSPLKNVMLALRNARTAGESIDLFCPKSVVLPFCKTDLPYSWTLHCHPIAFQQEGRSTSLMTIQAPSLTSPPPQVCLDFETATDHVIRLIDRAIENTSSEKRLLMALRERVLTGRMNEPMGTGPTGDDPLFPWDTSASLAMMLGLPFGEPGRDRISMDKRNPSWTGSQT